MGPNLCKDTKEKHDSKFIKVGRRPTRFFMNDLDGEKSFREM